MKYNSENAVKSATRAVDILEFVAAAAAPPSFSEIAEGLEIPNSSLFYLLSTLKARGYLNQGGDRERYTLGPALAALTNRTSESRAWRPLIGPLLHQITNALNETSTYGEQRGDEIECVEVRLASRTLQSVLHAGQRAPLYAFSGGKIMLAHWADEDVDRYISRTRFRAFTPNTIESGKALWRELLEVRATGIAYSREEHTVGVHGLSVPLKTQSGLIGTLGVAVPTARLDPASESNIRQQLEAAAATFVRQGIPVAPAAGPTTALTSAHRDGALR
jgi:DNA-binding IclR family transcriptional regulator